MNPGNDQIMACLAWGSPHIQNRRSKASVHNVLIPLDEGHLRMWLRELYPSQFSPATDLNAFDNASLELEEIRAVFRALQARLIKPVWVHSTIFNASVRESLGLVPRTNTSPWITQRMQVLKLSSEICSQFDCSRCGERISIPSVAPTKSGCRT